MEILTKFAIGDKVWTIHNFKVAQIEIGSITIDVNGVWIRSKDDYSAFHEDNCFPTKEALIAYISDDGNKNM